MNLPKDDEMQLGRQDCDSSPLPNQDQLPAVLRSLLAVCVLCLSPSPSGMSRESGQHGCDANIACEEDFLRMSRLDAFVPSKS